MDEKDITALERWVTNKYATGTSVRLASKTIVLHKDLVFHDGIKLYTDGIKEINKEFKTLNVSGFNYAMLCFYGKEYSSIEHRIIVFCNSNSDWDIGKYKKIIKEILNSYQ